ncbi:RNA polymerase sigma-70 factor [Mariniphaga sediminis]|uniref:RNA polymerase sigma-70 factor n=1 Tax=Mariniphaga sediminis TaxID=1628158 RepID=A0A399CS28_9BACT|nr:RNA polymerase sigma-70 factor [Mariniphaga sediminis]RIH62769.1 RNA polymerase sigma-70 factor [Mariniphaga sediminis]
MNKNERQLFERLRNDDEAAFKVLFNDFYSKLYYFVLEFIPLKDIAEDIVQDTLVTLWNKRSELKDDSNLTSYLFTVAKNNALKRLRDKKYRQKMFSNVMDVSELNLNVAALSTIDTSVCAFTDIEQIIQETLFTLPPQCRRVFELSRFQEMKNREIAEELNISVKTVEGHISKSIKTFKVALKDYLPLVAYLFVL